ncbi:MAG TPA: glycerophosphodiester phosphodiesterase family protein [Bacillota bacterium]
MDPRSPRCDPRALPGRRRPLIFGHRGLPGDRVENRIESLRACLALGADGVELDVRLGRRPRPLLPSRRRDR